MTKIAVTGGAGYVGRFIVDHLLAGGNEVVLFGRHAPSKDLFLVQVEYRHYALSDELVDASLFSDCDALVHAAFHHEAGKYRGGEGDDPNGFRRLNYDGSIALLNAAKAAGVKRVVFMSSRAVYGTQPHGAILLEGTKPNPDTLYGQVKLETENALAELENSNFLPIIVRATGIYGASAGSALHKWAALFDALEKAETIPPRIGTEVHGEDVAQAVGLLLSLELSKFSDMRIFNASDILLDRRDLLQKYTCTREINGFVLPQRSDPDLFNPMDCARLKQLGWKPRGVLDLTKIVDAAT